MFKGYILSFLLIGSILSSDADSGEFRYPNDEEDESNFTWGGKCETGNRQSPIELISKNAQRVQLDDLIYKNYDKNIESAKIVNNGHTINIHKFDKELTVEGGILDDNDTYILDQIHFHWPTEHVIDNKRYSLEMHLVHRHKDHASMSEAQKHKEGLLVLAVMFKAGEKEHENEALNKIFKNQMINNINDHTELNRNFEIGDFTIRDLMPAELDDNYFYYVGSLTTPPCTESVLWIVFNDLQRCSLEQLEVLNDIEDKSGDQIPMNSRYLQKAGQRPVFYVLDDEGDKDNTEDLNQEDHNDDDDDDDEDDDKNTQKEIQEKQEKFEKKHDKDDDENDDEDEHSNSLRFSASPITILIALTLTAIGAFRF